MKPLFTTSYITLGLCILAAPVYSTELADSTTPSKTKSVVKIPSSQLDWEFQIGLGYDNNIYSTPGSDYVDFAQGGQPTVSPVVNDGIYVPIDAEVSYESPISKQSSLIAAYYLKSIQYMDSDFSNANYTNHEINLGSKYVIRQKKGRENSVYYGIIVRDVYDQYVDRDTGDDQLGAGGSAADKYKYKAFGYEINYEKNIGLTDYDVKFKYLDKNYASVPATNVSEYDHEYMSISGSVKFTLSKTDKLKAKYKHYTTDYSERKARSATTGLLTAGTTLEYVYDEIALTYIKTPSKNLRLFFDYLYRTREDQYQAYNDYDKNELKLRALYDLNKAWKSRIAFKIWEREYPNGFAFDRPASQEDKSYDGMKLELDLDYKAAKNKSYLFRIEWTDENSTDERYEYDRLRAALGVKWTK